MAKNHDGLSESLEDLKRSTQQAQAAKLKSDPAIVIEREFHPALDGENALLRKVGERIRPKGHRHISSFAIHAYKDESSINGQFIAQVTGIDMLPLALAQDMLKELTIHVAHKYGQAPQSKKGEDHSYKNVAAPSPIVQMKKPPLET